MVRYNFEWDPEKAKGNRAKHEVAFENAATEFRDPNALSVLDEDHSEKEERWITMGFDTGGSPGSASHVPERGRVDLFGSRDLRPQAYKV